MDRERILLKKAFKIMRRNYGCPGNDGLNIKYLKKEYDKFEQVLLSRIKQGEYGLNYIPKSTIIIDYLGNNRTINIYDVLERWLQQYLKIIVEPYIEANLSDNIYAYRRGKAFNDAAKSILKQNPKYILRLDIINFFGSIKLDKLFVELEKTGLDIKYIDAIKCSLGDNNRGLPQGHVLSCMLSNYFLSGFDKNFKVNYCRYSDDMMFSSQTIYGIIKIFNTVRKLLKSENMTINYKKIRIIYKPSIGKL